MTSAERTRRWRERQQTGTVVLHVEVDLDRVTKAMMDSGRLGPFSEDRDLLETAVADFLHWYADFVTRHRKRDESRGIFGA